MRSFAKWFEHLVGGMLQGCLAMALFAAVVSVAVYGVVKHQLPQGLSLGFIIALVIVCGLFGATAALAWRLSHIAEIVHVAKEVSQHGLQKPEINEHA